MSGAERTWQGGTGNRSGTQVGMPAKVETGALVKSNTGAFRDLAKVNQAITALQEVANVVTPVAMLAEVPDGCSVVLAPVAVSTANPGETYKAGSLKVGNNYVDTFGLSKATLERIAAAAGVSVLRSSRTDNGRNALVCCWSVTVGMPNVYGETVQVTKSVELDMTDGSPEAVALLGANNSQKSLDQQRRFIVRIAESKATARAIRSLLSLPTAMTAEQLRKPFVAVKVVFDGSFDDVEMRREYARARIAQATGAAHLLTGRRPTPAPEPVLVPDEGPDGYEDADVVDEPGPGPDESQDTGSSGPVDSEGWPEGHPLSTGKLMALAKAKGRTGKDLAELAEWLVRPGNRTPERRKPLHEGLVGRPDPIDDDPAPF